MALVRKLFIFAIASLAACASQPKTTPRGKAIVMIKSPFAETCLQLGKIKYDGTPFVRGPELKIIMKEQAAKMKGNSLRMDQFKPGVTGVNPASARGTVYVCKKNELKAYIDEKKRKKGNLKKEIESFENSDEEEAVEVTE